MGDPETQVVIPRLDCDLLDVLEAAAKGNLSEVALSIKPDVATTVVSVAGGYPEAYDKGKVISGLEKEQKATIFHAGTKSDGENVVTNGGRVLAATGTGKNIQEALDNSYSVYSSIEWQDIYFRRDIGQDLLNL
jgi:phosphoribosylamine--glycine ligase